MPAVKDGHRRTVSWMATDAFQRIFNLYESVTGPGKLYYRATEDGIIPIALLDEAPAYVGFGKGVQYRDKIREGDSAPDLANLRQRWGQFCGTYLPAVRRKSREERGVIPWVRQAHQNHLLLPGMNESWVFLNQEWRFIDGQGGRKSDVLAVHPTTGELAIIEFKDKRNKQAEALAQLCQYEGYWRRDAIDLAPFFSCLANAIGRLYGRQDASPVQIDPNRPARLFWGVACRDDAGQGPPLFIEEVRPQ